MAEVLYEPTIARILLLVGRGKGRQAGHVCLKERDPLEIDVIAAVSLETLGKIVLGHIKPGRVIVTDIEDHERAAIVVVLRNLADACRAANPHISQVSRCGGWVRAGGWFRTWPARVPAAVGGWAGSTMVSLVAGLVESRSQAAAALRNRA